LNPIFKYIFTIFVGKSPKVLSDVSRSLWVEIKGFQITRSLRPSLLCDFFFRRLRPGKAGLSKTQRFFEGPFFP
jgi:hypothetical protein